MIKFGNDIPNYTRLINWCKLRPTGRHFLTPSFWARIKGKFFTLGGSLLGQLGVKLDVNPTRMSKETTDIQFHTIATGRSYIKGDEFFKNPKIKATILALLSSTIYKQIKEREKGEKQEGR